MNPTSAQFRLDFPEFADTSIYPDALIELWLQVAITLLANGRRWGAMLKIGTELCAAHYIVLAVRDLQAAGVGALPGRITGLQTSKSVGDVSASYDYSAVLPTDAQFWNQSSYGVRFWGFARMIGAGGLQLGGSQHILC